MNRRDLMRAGAIATLLPVPFIKEAFAADQNPFTNPFNKKSPFHRPMGTGASFAPASHAINNAFQAVPFSTLNVNNGYGFNLFVNSASDPLLTVTIRGSGSHPGLPYTMHVPAGARNPTSGTEVTDSVVVIYDVAGGGRMHEFYGFRHNGSTVQAVLRKEWDGHGDGIGVGTSASRLAGLFTVQRGFELNNNALGRIGHVFTMSLRAKSSPQQLDNRFIWPARAIDGFCSNSAYCNGAVPYGALFAIPPGVAMPSLSPLGQRLWAQARDYGCYIVDNSSGNNCRGNQDVLSATRTAYIAAMKIIKPSMRWVQNNADNVVQPTASGGGTPLAPNTAFDA